MLHYAQTHIPLSISNQASSNTANTKNSLSTHSYRQHHNIPNRSNAGGEGQETSPLLEVYNSYNCIWSRKKAFIYQNVQLFIRSKTVIWMSPCI